MIIFSFRRALVKIFTLLMVGLLHAELGAETLTVSNTGVLNLDESNGRDGQFGQVFDFDTATGAITKEQNIMDSVPAILTVLERSRNGTLYGVDFEGQLVSINERTGLATRLAEVGGQSFFGPWWQSGGLTLHGLSFVPEGGAETLYGLIRKFQVFGETDPAPALSDGFNLVRIDRETGDLTNTGIDLSLLNSVVSDESSDLGLEFDSSLRLFVAF